MKIPYNIYISQVQKLFELDIITAEEFELIIDRIIQKIKDEKGDV